LTGQPDSLFDLPEQPRKVPVKMAPHLDRFVWEAVDLLERKVGTVKTPQNDPAALRAQVDGE
jgi:hypothetical protein